MNTLSVPTQTPTQIDDAVNAAILSVSEDRIQGFLTDPLGEIAHLSETPVDVVIARIQAMLRAGTIRRVRQTLMATNLAQGSLVAWQIPAERLDAAFDFMFGRDPFSGHVVIRSADAATPGSSYRLWTTLKAPQGYSLHKHAQFLAERVGAERFLLMPAKRLFALGVGHVRRKGTPIGSLSDAPAEVLDTNIVALSDLDWQVLVALKREFEPDEIIRDLWRARAEEAGVDMNDVFGQVAQFACLNGKRNRAVLHVSGTRQAVHAEGVRVTRYNALFHWAVPHGPRDRGGAAGGPLRDHDTRLLARGRTRIS